MLRNCNVSNIYLKCTRVACGHVSRSSQNLKRNCCIDDRHNEVLPLLFRNSQSSGQFNPNYEVLAAHLKSCAALLAINSGRTLHGYIVKRGDLSCLSVSKALLNMYAKCGALDDCKTLFGQICYPDSVIWNIVLSGFAASWKFNGEVMKVFHEMHVVGVAKPTSVTFAIVLPACARIGHIDMGKSVHAYAIKAGLETDVLVGNALISMYAKCGLVSDDAYTVFENITGKDVVSWNAMIAGFSENKLMKKAYELFCQMVKGTVDLNYATIATILPICASLDKNAYWSGRQIHCYVLRRDELAADVSVCNALVSFYLLSGQIEKAESLFYRMESRDLVSWNAIIAGYASNGEWLKSLELFHKLISLEMMRPDSVTIVSILPACAQLKLLQVGREIHGYILRRPMLYESTTVGNAMLSLYVKCDKVEDAVRTFLMMSRRDLISWNTMLVAFSGICNSTKFLNLLNGLLKGGMIPDQITILTIIQFCCAVLRVEKVKETHSFSIKAGLLLNDIEPNIGNAILDAYAKCGKMDYAYKIFQSLSQKKKLVTGTSMITAYMNYGSHDDEQMTCNCKCETDLISWNLMVRAYAENDCPAEAMNLFYELQAQGMKPDAMAIMSLLPVSAQISSVHLLRQCHGYVVRAFLHDVYLTGALLDMYAKCGAILCAYKLFQSCLNKDLVMFTAMISGFAMHGMGEEAIGVFSHMLKLGIQPDNVTITAVLSACSHAGLVDEGLKIFCTIDEVYGVKPTMEQYACVVDLLARGGRIDDAFSFVSKMPIEANANIWGTLLGACRTHHMVELGRVVADHLFKIEVNNIGNYMVMSNLYASEARWDGVMEVRQLMRIRDLKKPAGCSWIEVERRTNGFIAGDLSHPQRSIIYNTLSTLDQQIKEPV
ncbi:putative pentatricopeptide repeat-containing protein At5g08490 [Argentina anserina]|uniref:putative pentatricopeptide repeat-containing protein At5g08490 n=1 Tax=Argentina anserina TaxID=57926 RepID=UPI0021765D4D|nr:putative pentatricopeptide repeat-containing protein At5g08490 [Potentilla anserina]